jgi:hypothetical protein
MAVALFGQKHNRVTTMTHLDEVFKFMLKNKYAFPRFT